MSLADNKFLSLCSVFFPVGPVMLDEFVDWVRNRTSQSH